jgi:hypothetical protein
MLGRLAWVALLLAFGSGCSSTSCDDALAYSVVVRVVDQDGEQVDDVEVVFTVNGSAERACANGTPFLCGAELEGDFVITARKAGYNDAKTNVHVGREPDGCHVEGEQVTLTLTPS